MLANIDIKGTQQEDHQRRCIFRDAFAQGQGIDLLWHLACKDLYDLREIWAEWERQKAIRFI